MNKQEILELSYVILQKVAQVAGIPSAETAIVVIRAMVSHLIDAEKGKVTPEKVREEVDRLLAALQTNDDATDAALREKFGKKS